MKRSFDLIATVYQPLELLCFGHTLQLARRSYLPSLLTRKNGLLLGDGDGRFSSELLKVNSEISLLSIDSSSKMLERARKRAGSNAARVEYRCANLLSVSYPISTYDFIGLHFVLDCFSQNDVESLLPRLERSLTPGGVIAYSDFQDKTRFNRTVVRLLYLCFDLATKLRLEKLPRIDWPRSLSEIHTEEFLNGLVVAKLLQKAK